MIILSVLAALVIIGLLIWHFSSKGDGWETTGIAMTFFGGFILLIALITIPTNHIDVKSQIRQFEAVKMTVQVARQDDSIKLESAALQIKIAEMNQWLAMKQYWRETIYKIWTPKVIKKLEPIR